MFGSLLNSIMTLILPDAWSLFKVAELQIINNNYITTKSLSSQFLSLDQEEGDQEVIVSDRGEQFESWEASLHSMIQLKRGQKVLRAIRRFVQTSNYSEYEDIIDQICRE